LKGEFYLLKNDLNNVENNLNEIRDNKADINYVNDNFDELKKIPKSGYVGTIELNKVPDLSDEFIKLREK